MWVSQIAQVVLSLAILISPMHATLCARDDESEFNDVVQSNDIKEKCGNAASNIFQSSSTSTALVCTKPGCVEAIASIIDKVPDCNLGTMTLETNLRAIVRMCEDERDDGSSAPGTVGPAGGPPGSSGSPTSSTRDPTAECTEEQKAQAKKLSESAELRKACGDDTTKPPSAADSPMCSRPECMAYANDTYMNELPDCTVLGSSGKTAMKLAIAVCEVSPESVPEPSEARIVSMSTTVALGATLIAGQLIA
ncbi:hypothetical protein Poli38472_007800 [Pythium oligandrum]|uniref:Elicitin-like protein n=1 Tax=Pythium oligandrum TaxID=41045 RepID=A0A8K1FS18_PYTOL|nr:hypothetical protein Poli38472_007800 [Pythium oligandrum]|eukprot:TMW68128.1 hypothetical protein Poli38472_007800 [Pythium oligandrum]